MPLRLVFCGTPEFALPSLQHLIAQPDFHVQGVVTQPDRPRGRGQETTGSQVKEAALAAGIAVYQPEKIRSDSALEYFQRVAPDVVVIIAYGQIIPKRLLEIPRLGWINLHGSLLPKYRGAAPIHWAIANGETQTGLTTMQVDAGLDTGPTLLALETEIGADETAPELSARLAEAGAPLVAETLRRLERGDIEAKTQDAAAATLAPLLKKQDGRVDLKWSAAKIYNRIRGLQPWPGTFTTFRGKSCHIWGKPVEGRVGAGSEAGTIVAQGGDLFVVSGEGTALRLESLQMEGRKRVKAREFANGAHLREGERFGS